MTFSCTAWCMPASHTAFVNALRLGLQQQQQPSIVGCACAHRSSLPPTYNVVTLARNRQMVHHISFQNVPFSSFCAQVPLPLPQSSHCWAPSWELLKAPLLGVAAPLAHLVSCQKGSATNFSMLTSTYNTQLVNTTLAITRPPFSAFCAQALPPLPQSSRC
jgi:hypothetical protein